MSASRPLRVQVNEGTSPVYTATLLDYDGEPIPLSAMDSLVLTLRNTATGAVVNGRENEDILNAGIGSYDETSGLLTVRFTPDDMAIDTTADTPGDTQPIEATFAAAWYRGMSMPAALTWRVVFDVRNLYAIAKQETPSPT